MYRFRDPVVVKISRILNSAFLYRFRDLVVVKTFRILNSAYYIRHCEDLRTILGVLCNVLGELRNILGVLRNVLVQCAKYSRCLAQ